MRRALLAVVLLVAVACSDDGDDPSTADADGTTTTVLADDPDGATTSSVPGDDGTGGSTGDDVTDPAADPSGEPVADPVVEGACTLLPPGTTVEGLGEIPAGIAGGDDRRQVCVFAAGDVGNVAITLGLEEGDRFADKVAASQAALGVDGEPVDGLGDQARFFFSDADIPEGVGGVVVTAAGRTFDLTLQGLTEPELRTAALALAAVAVANLQ